MNERKTGPITNFTMGVRRWSVRWLARLATKLSLLCTLCSLSGIRTWPRPLEGVAEWTVFPLNMLTIQRVARAPKFASKFVRSRQPLSRVESGHKRRRAVAL